MPAIPEKPNYVFPSTATNKAELAAANQTLKEVCSVKNSDLTPPEKFESPQTSAQECGWHSKVKL